MNPYLWWLLVPIVVIAFFAKVYFVNNKKEKILLNEPGPITEPEEPNTELNEVAPENPIQEYIASEMDEAPEIPSDHPELPSQEDIDEIPNFTDDEPEFPTDDLEEHVITGADRDGDFYEEDEDFEEEDVMGETDIEAHEGANAYLIYRPKALRDALMVFEENLPLVVRCDKKIVAFAIGGHHNPLPEEAPLVSWAVNSLTQLIESDQNHNIYDLRFVDEEGCLYPVPHPYRSSEGRVVFKLT